MLSKDKAKKINPVDRKLHNPPKDFLQELVSSGLFLISIKIYSIFQPSNRVLDSVNCCVHNYWSCFNNYFGKFDHFTPLWLEVV